MPSLRAVFVAGLLTADLASTAHAASRTVVVKAPTTARVTIALTAPIAAEEPPILTVFVAPRQNLRRLRINPALYPDWSGFQQHYSGPRYPF